MKFTISCGIILNTYFLQKFYFSTWEHRSLYTRIYYKLSLNFTLIYFYTIANIQHTFHHTVWKSSPKHHTFFQLEVGRLSNANLSICITSPYMNRKLQTEAFSNMFCHRRWKKKVQIRQLEFRKPILGEKVIWILRYRIYKEWRLTI